MIASGIIFDIKHFALHDGPGIRTTVFFKGCPLNCWWCHNPEGYHPEIEKLKINRRIKNCEPEVVGRMVTVAELMTEVGKDRIFYDESGGGITISGGEPLAQPEFLFELLTSCRQENISTVVDTSGFTKLENFKRLAGLVDLYLYDLKIMDDNLHQRHTGVSNTKILNNLTWLVKNGEQLQIRVPLIPGITATKDNLTAIAGHIKSLDGEFSVTLLPFNLLARDKFHKFNLPNKLTKMRTQSTKTIERMGEPFRSLKIPVTSGG